ncbi:MAG TPA: efflux RND transporter periplasmic adaptor subunit [Bryobacteraceae bacterium]|nr:efflux RND transporter periplasmic adaptor subunit [Bryobacteraceae bacterium]
MLLPAILLPLALMFAGCGAQKPTEPAPPAEAKKAAPSEIVLTPAQVAAAMIQTETAAMSDQPAMLQLKGRIVLADDRVWRVGVRTAGLAMAVYAGLGDHVEKGQVLARYHADEVREERAHYRAAQSELRLAEAQVAQAQRNRDRAQRLLDLKAGAVQQVEQAQQDLVTAQAAVRRAQIEVERGQDLLEYDLKVGVEPAPATAGEFADDVPILAPASGYVIEKNITPGKAIDLAAQTFVIGDLSKVWMLASVRQEDLGGLRAGTPAIVTLPGDTARRFPGRITNLGQQFDPATRTMEIRIALDNSRTTLRPEMLANAEIPSGPRRQVLSVSPDSVQQLDNTNVVFVETQPGHFAIRAVQTGETAGGRTPIYEGIRPGDKVVVRGSFLLRSQLLKSAIEGE